MMKAVRSSWKAAAAYALAGLTALAGVFSLGLFARFLSQRRLGAAAVAMSPFAALALDTLLCLLFFVQHSGMVRRSFQTWSGRRMPACFQRTLYTFASAAALVLLCALWQPAGPALVVLGGTARAIVRALSLLAILGFLWALVSLGAFDAFGGGALLASFRRREPVSERLTVKGPYRWIRHPFYLCAIVLLWATPALSTDRLLLNALFTIWIVLGATWEERDLAAAFGEDYRRYQAQVPMLIPWKLPKPRPAATHSYRRARIGSIREARRAGM